MAFMGPFIREFAVRDDNQKIIGMRTVQAPHRFFAEGTDGAKNQRGRCFCKSERGREMVPCFGRNSAGDVEQHIGYTDEEAYGLSEEELFSWLLVVGEKCNNCGRVTFFTEDMSPWKTPYGLVVYGEGFA